jgi:hypothetical protein
MLRSNGPPRGDPFGATQADTQCVLRSIEAEAGQDGRSGGADTVAGARNGTAGGPPGQVSPQRNLFRRSPKPAGPRLWGRSWAYSDAANGALRHASPGPAAGVIRRTARCTAYHGPAESTVGPWWNMEHRTEHRSMFHALAGAIPSQAPGPGNRSPNATGFSLAGRCAAGCALRTSHVQSAPRGGRKRDRSIKVMLPPKPRQHWLSRPHRAPECSGMLSFRPACAAGGKAVLIVAVETSANPHEHWLSLLSQDPRC